jgi:hypothetical protein
MDTTFNISISTTSPALAAELSKLVADFETAHGERSVEVRPDASPTRVPNKSPTDDALVGEIVDALTYQPLHPTQTLTLGIWYKAPDWVPVGVLQERLLAERLAGDATEAVARVRGLLAGFAIRLGQKAAHAGARKLAALVDIRYAYGSASHRLTNVGREAVKRALKL